MLSPLLEKWRRIVFRLLALTCVNRMSLVFGSQPREPTPPPAPTETSNTHAKKCSHPEKSRQKGANQHGVWVRCLVCKTKISYTPYDPRERNPEGRSRVVSTQVRTEIASSSTSAPTYAVHEVATSAAEATVGQISQAVESLTHVVNLMIHLVQTQQQLQMPVAPQGSQFLAPTSAPATETEEEDPSAEDWQMIGHNANRIP